MEVSMIRMMAYLIDFDKIEVKLSTNYYQGLSPRFYLRNNDLNTTVEIKAVRQENGKDFNLYYFEDIDIDFEHHYQVVDNYGLTETLQYVRLVESERFDDVFSYKEDDLGSRYHKTYTSFKVWAPTAIDVCVKVGHTTYQMKRQDRGVFFARVKGDLDNAPYLYLIKHYQSYVEALDPYALASGANGLYNRVIDLYKVTEDLHRHDLPHLSKKTSAIIYEASVRDFTMDPAIDARHPGTFLGFVETGLKTPGGHFAGIDYLKDLGITHVQLMPIYDFATVDETQPRLMYNWGYDPMQYGIPEGSFATDPDDGYSRIKECRHMVSVLHMHGIRVVMDVVYNHMYDVNASAFERIVPGYYFRKDDKGHLSNGSWCGNDLNTKADMVRRYILQISKRWQTLYGIDGFRFDLMGIIDIKTLNALFQQASDIDDSFIMYGEGWNMQTALKDEDKGMQDNHQKMLNIGFFNDQYRETLKGGSSDDALASKGYFAGNMYNCEISGECMKATNRYSYVDQSINYVECHDNATVYDKLLISNGDESEEVRLKRQLMMNVAVILSQGIPFLHCGQEFYRSKDGIGNTYNAPDEINAVKWALVDQHRYTIETVKQMIKLRKKNEAFQYETIEEVNKYVKTSHMNYEVLRYRVKQVRGKYKEIVVYMNPSYCSYQIGDMDGYELIYNDNDSRDQLSAISMKIFGLKRDRK